MNFRNQYPLVKQLESYLEPRSFIADIGSFEGDVGLSLAEKGHIVANVDVSHEALNVGLARFRDFGSVAAKSFFIQGDASHLMFAEESFDVVLSMNMLQLLRRPNVSKALSEMQRITKQNGYNAIKVYAGTPSEIAFRPKYSIFNFGELREIYDSIGWQILEHDERHDIPASAKDVISSYSRIIARKPEKNKKQKLELLREAEYYHRSDVEHYEYLMMLLSEL